MKKKTGFILIAIVLVLLVAGSAVVLLTTGKGDKETAKVKEKTYNEEGVRTFADWTEVEVFQNVPALIAENGKIGGVTDYGEKNYIMDINGAVLSDYKAYLLTLEEAGFMKHADNGEKGLYEEVYTATYAKESLGVVVTYIKKWDKIFIVAKENMNLSPWLNYSEEYVKDNIEGAKTTLHMRELYDNGNSFIIQLKNGHLIVNDGGDKNDAPYLFDYMESLVPKGQKPVIDAWIISHAHADHYGSMYQVMAKPDYAKRVDVEGFYYSLPSNDAIDATDATCTASVRNIEMASRLYKNGKGETTPVYRLHTGEIYYFNDITMEVTLTQEQIAVGNYNGDFNDTSTWLMYNIEGQRYALCGDAYDEGARVAMSIWDSEYFDTDVFTVFHHGINVWNEFTDYCTFKTLLYPCYRRGSLWPDSHDLGHKAENDYLQSQAVEVLAFGKGTQVLTFPYEIGTAKTLDPIDWSQYTPGLKKYGIWQRNEAY